MSDIGLGGPNARGTNGGARTAGPVPVVQPTTSSGALRTPRDVVRNRQEREARRRAEEELAKREQEVQRRVAVDRRAAAAAAGAGQMTAARSSGEQRRSGGNNTTSEQYPAASSAGAYSGKTPLRAPQQAYPTPSTGDSNDLGREKPTTRGGSAVRSEEAKPVANQSATGVRSGDPQRSGLRQSSAPASTAAANTSASQQAPIAPKQRENASSFPHAFERWETLSSHWEGLTSYWLHKLELNQEQIAKNIPSASAMSRQITDLSAAGANLFHAVVELQRLRASSERKFQRWFFETRADQERAGETQAELERALQAERTARTEARAERTRAEQAKRTADNMVKDMRRELAISKEEARRAWEELGRREQEERDRTTSLRAGQPTVVGGVQVVPKHTQMAHTAHPTSEPQQSRQESYPEQAYYEEGPSPTDTDPFTETSRRAPPLHHEPEITSIDADTYPPYPQGSTPATSGSVQTAIPAGPGQSTTSTTRSTTRSTQAPQTTELPPSTMPAPTRLAPTSPPPTEPSRFYQQPSRQTNLYAQQNDPEDPERAATPAAATLAARDLRSEPSYVSSLSDTEYEIGSDGQLRRDDQGRPLVYHRSRDRRPSGSAGNMSEVSEDYDIQADIEREREMTARYRAGYAAGQSSAAPGIPGTSAEAMAGYSVPAPPPSGVARAEDAASGYSYVGSGSSAGAPDYEGQGYGATGQPGTRQDGEAALLEDIMAKQAAERQQFHESGLSRTAHHHPTRLSDVPEDLEEDERSRASHGSRHGRADT